MAWAAPPATSRRPTPRWLFVHQSTCRSSSPPFMMTVAMIHTSGTRATRNAAHMTTVAIVFFVARPPDWPLPESEFFDRGSGAGFFSREWAAVLIR